ncbi:protein-L-isoaspartate(D-aspartate) O-methyltransferase [Pseudemcibacter aquimaris]|uniref:protein-L-isoaspartate(D-aspartate) O-methyltransferase n=1 Tax=Pseudemcibacter aquimaris TaxID=2857064 RepID=UPI0020127443|nr:protein-L-isoaspartate(D-aspartate) O-methyltransferase [Pseudemcibacter aquimaris]MCC3860539.1 protein-L-isoaspartate(D-aspartate) O-methyltransferase [Pseudemcibacter aquimaris]WDU59363.1 protein-L-isoaspartate(D-aspartate) O-methyltransferase [Pseudemcibacter aquimaris]
MNIALDDKKERLLKRLREQGIKDEDVLDVIAEIPREEFIAPFLRAQAYENAALPIESEQTISQPFVVAYMTQELRLEKTHKVLEIGTGSGYQAAILSKLCRRLFTVERHLPLYESATALFKKLRLYNITTLFGNGMRGWKEQQPFDRIMVTAAGEEIPDDLLYQLKDGGIMVIPVGAQDETQHIVRITRTGDDFDVKTLLPVKFVPLLSGIVHSSE